MLFKTATLLLASMASMASANDSENALTPANQGERKLQNACAIGERCCVGGDCEAFQAFGATNAGVSIFLTALGDDSDICATLEFEINNLGSGGGAYSGTDIELVGPVGDGTGFVTRWTAEFDITNTVLSSDPNTATGATLKLRCTDMKPDLYFTAGPFDFDASNGAESLSSTLAACDTHGDHTACQTSADGQSFLSTTLSGAFFRREDDTVAPQLGFTVKICATKIKGEVVGEPHIHTWGGEWFDFQGGCDLVMLSNADFLNGLGLDIHIRTIVRYDYSFIRSVAVRLGEDTLEVSSYGAYSVNGVSDVPLPLSLASGHTIFHRQISPKKHEFTLPTGNGDEAIVITTMKDIVNVNVLNVSPDLAGSVGLMGSFDLEGRKVGTLLGRDGETVFEDHDAFGFEWQVNDQDPQLFRAPGDVVYPQKCAMPTLAANGRRLGESKVSKEEAEKACANKSGKDKENCIYDVLALGDADMVV
jgi:hypothetical protein